MFATIETSDASRALAADANSLLAHGFELTLALAIGATLARVLRRRGLHWSWTAVAFALAFLLDGALGALEPFVLALLAMATVRGRRHHRDDLDAGLDLARGARGRVTPAHTLRAAARLLNEQRSLAGTAAELRARMRPSVLAAPSAAGTNGRLMLGFDTGGQSVLVPFARGGGHTLVVGATGSGKTVTQSLFAERAIGEGRGAIVVDPKGDAELRSRLAAAADRASRTFIEWTPSGPTAYNPYARGGETEIADRLLAGERFTEPHYLRQAQRYLGHAVRALRACEIEVSLATILEALDPVALEQLLRRAPEEHAARGHAYLDSLTSRQLRDLAGVRDRLAILAESDVGRWLEPAAGERPGFDLLEAARARSVVYLALEADSRPLLAQMLGAAIVQDLQSAVAEMQSSPVPTLVAIDEFAAVSAEGVVALFGRARSAGISLLLGTQEIADLRLPGRERMLEQVLGNLSLLIAHRQVVPASAELISRLAGERGTWRVSRSSGGRTTRTRSVEAVISPGELAALAPGHGAVIAFGTPERARLARILPAGEVSR